MEFNLVKEVITLLIAAGGFGLGIYNLVRSKQEEKVVLVVKPVAIYELKNKQYATNDVEIPGGKELHTIGIKVINLSKFDVSLTETGFQLAPNNEHERLCFPHALVLGTSNYLPVRVPSRESVLIAFSPDQLPSTEIRKNIEAVYIHTACELEFFGKSKVIDDYKSV